MYVNRLRDGMVTGVGHLWLMLTPADLEALQIAYDSEDDSYVLRSTQHEGDRDIHVRIGLSTASTTTSCPECLDTGYTILECDEDGLCPPIPPLCSTCDVYNQHDSDLASHRVDL